MIVDLQRFLTTGRPYWSELETQLNKLDADPSRRMDLEHVKRFHYLYQRVSADLAQLATFAAEPELRRYLETLVARAYSEIHETREKRGRFRPLDWFITSFPQTFRQRIGAFKLSLAITLVGCLFGGMALNFDPEAKTVVIGPFRHLLGDPTERVAHEESAVIDKLAGKKATFSSALMTNNIRVSITALVLGISWGIGTVIILFYNGVILGAVALDYVQAGQTEFLLGWLMPHGVIEIPAILIAGQGGLVLAQALIGYGSRATLKTRLRAVTPDLATLIGGVAVMLVWAGFIEAFLSQYHKPVMPYSIKIAFGAVELVVLWLFLTRSGRVNVQKPAVEAPGSIGPNS
jgi:uncharacterized membrane protein SpoIIM required for sporulation